MSEIHTAAVQFAASRGIEKIRGGKLPVWRPDAEPVVEPIPVASEREARDWLTKMVDAALTAPTDELHYLEVGTLREDGRLDVVEATIISGRTPTSAQVARAAERAALQAGTVPFEVHFRNAISTHGRERHGFETLELAREAARTHRPWNNTAADVFRRDEAGRLVRVDE